MKFSHSFSAVLCAIEFIVWTNNHDDDNDEHVCYIRYLTSQL